MRCISTVQLLKRIRLTAPATIERLRLCPMLLFAAVCLLLVASPPAVADDWRAEHGDDRHQQIVDRYQQMLEQDPGDEQILERLLDHIGTSGLDDLVDHYRRRADDEPDAARFQLILGHLQRARSNHEQALEHYDRALELDEDHPAGWLGRGTARLQLGDEREALEDFDEALERETAPRSRRRLLEQIGELAFSQRQFDRGMQFFEQLIDENPRDRHLRMDYVQLLVQHRQLEEAVEQYEQLRPLVATDPREEANLLRDKADVHEMLGDHDAALQSYEQLLERVSSDSWLAREARDHIVDIYRRTGRLEEFLDNYADSWRHGEPAQQIAVADVRTELGELRGALDDYRRIARSDASAVEPREKAIRLLERLGEDDEITGVYQELIRAAPDSEHYPIELAEHHVQLGDRDAAGEVLDRARRRFSQRAWVLLDIADAYRQFNFEQRARDTYETAVRRRGDDPEILVEVGDYFHDRGDTERAVQIWERLPDSRLGERDGLRRKADVLIERGLLEQGIEVYDRLLEDAPDDERLLRSMARALERAERWQPAIERWETLLETSDSTRHRRRARGRIVQLYDRLGELPARIRELEQSVDTDADPGVDTALLLAEAHLHRQNYEEAERALQSHETAARLDDRQRAAVLRLLERTHVRAGDYREAIDVAGRLADYVPDHTELLRRKSDYAMEVRDFEAAVDFSRRALQQNPGDASAYEHLGDVHRRAGQLDEAIDRYATAVDIDPRAREVQLQLGETLHDAGRTDEAREVLLEVVADASNPQLVRDAGDLMLQIAAERNELQQLETDFAPLVFRLPIEPVHARLMSQLYEKIAGPRMLRAHHGDPRQRRQARRQLAELGERAGALLMERLGDDEPAVRTRAVRLVAELDVDTASRRLARLIESPGDDPVKNGAIVAAAAIASDDLTDPVAELVEQGDTTRRQLAVWALGFVDSSRSRNTLHRVLDGDASDLESALAAQGLARIGADPEAIGSLASQLNRLAEQPETATGPRPAAVVNLIGDIASTRGCEEFGSALQTLASAASTAVARRAAAALGGCTDVDSSHRLWELTLDENPTVSERGEHGLAAMHTPRPDHPSWRDGAQAFDWSSGEFDAATAVRRGVEHRRARLSGFEPPQWSEPIEQGLVEALDDTDPDQLRRHLQRIEDWLASPHHRGLYGDGGAARFAELVRDNYQLEQLDADTAVITGVLAGESLDSLELEADDARMHTALRAAAIAPPGAGQTAAQLLRQALNHPDPALRRRALNTAAQLRVDDPVRDEIAADIVSLLDDEDTAVQLAAMRTAGDLRLDDADDAAEQLEPHAPPQLRRAIRQLQRQLDASE